jgi:arsenate reductase (thioredoxin)
LESTALKKRILFLCTGNSCRSQMAEGWANHLLGDVIEAHSAGTEPTRVDPRAVKAMAEAGAGMLSHRSKSVLDLPDGKFDYVITVCDNAREACPFFPAKTAVVHRGFDDPLRLAACTSDEEEAMSCYRQVRDEIRTYVEALPDTLIHKESHP